MEAFKIENLTFTYPQSHEAALRDVSFTVNEGEFVTVCGKSGSGKSTLLRHLVPSAALKGDRSGSIRFMNRDIDTLANIAFVQQSADNAIVTDKVWHELAFGLENLGMETPKIRARVAEMASFFGIHTWFHKDTASLSGGQKQLLCLASIMVMQPRALVLDEPTAQLDPIAAQEFLTAVKRINQELGVTVIMTEHRLEDALGLSDRVIVLSQGAVLADCKPCELCKNIGGHDMMYAMPSAMRVYDALGGTGDAPVTIREGRAFIENYAKTTAPKITNKPSAAAHNEPPVAEIKDVYFRYDKKLDDVLCGLNMRVYAGEIYAVTGGNGAGKTTALGVLSGINKPYRGRVTTNGTVGALSQNPKLMFAKKTVRAELNEMTADTEAISSVTELCELSGLFDRHPYDLSGGEQQRLALAKVLLTNPKILLLDEPTKGMDAYFKRQFARILTTLKQSGTAIVIVSHDIEFCAEYADRCALFFDGAVTSEGTAQEFFMSNSFYTTAARRMANGIVDNAVTVGDITKAFGKKIKDIESPKQNIIYETPRAETKPKTKPPKITKQTIAAALMILIAVPFTIFIGERFFGGRKYYFISMLIVLEAIIPFAFIFEGRRPKPRELVIMSVMCALAVAGRGVFYSLPQFKPMAAIVIIAGAALGGEAGFLVGAVSAFVSNMFFGQGPWTTWQMLALGLTGLISGVLFYGRKPKRVLLAIYGFVITMTVYGVLMNVSSVVSYQSELNLSMILAEEVMGLPFDLIHAVATAFFLIIAAPPMLDKVDRIKIKYGLRE